MKIKNDFVTNSSSCSYIVCIPDMEKFLSDLAHNLDEPLSSEFESVFRSRSQYLYFGEEYDEEAYDTFEKINKVADELGYVLMFDECGPENQPRYINIANNEKQVKKLKKILGVK